MPRRNCNVRTRRIRGEYRELTKQTDWWNSPEYLEMVNAIVESEMVGFGTAGMIRAGMESE